jgi:hypothetical protein
MEGINYLIDEKGQKTAVQIDLKEHGDLWEDFEDTLIAESRANDPRESLESVKNKLKEKGKLIE